jgi:transposase
VLKPLCKVSYVLSVTYKKLFGLWCNVGLWKFNEVLEERAEDTIVISEKMTSVVHNKCGHQISFNDTVD